MESMLDRPEQELVLVVDDTPDNLLLMRELLEEQYRVRTAGSGPAGLRAAVEEPRPDLILLDVNMPGMDGYEVCRRLKADPLTRDIPLMFLTARADRDDEQQGLALGAVDYLGKPVSPPIVLARVRTHLQLKANADFLRDKSEYLEPKCAVARASCNSCRTPSSKPWRPLAIFATTRAAAIFRVSSAMSGCSPSTWRRSGRSPTS